MRINSHNMNFNKISEDFAITYFRKIFAEELSKKEDLTFDVEAQQFMLSHCKEFVRFIKVKEILLMAIEYDGHTWVHSNHINNSDLQNRLAI